MTPRLAIAALAFCVAACGGGGGGGGSGDAPAPPAPPSTKADINLLFMGNSHTSFNNLPDMVTAMVRAARPGRTVARELAPEGVSLQERPSNPGTNALLADRTWSFVVLQAQDYSMSGTVIYPIDGAVEMVRRSRANGAVPILFPEWPRRGIQESQRIYDVHLSIAIAMPACIAPIPQAFDLARARTPSLVLHAPDGNHSAPEGAFLAALIIATTMTGTPPDTLPEIGGFGISSENQARLRGVAAETVLAYAPRQWCPADPPLPR